MSHKAGIGYGISFAKDNSDSFKKAFSYLEKNLNISKKIQLDRYGKAGVEALRQATPVDTGKTRDSWSYKITATYGGKITVEFFNSNINEGVNIAIIIQYGHMTGDGYYIQGLDYINPALTPVFQDMADDIWKEVTSIE